MVGTFAMAVAVGLAIGVVSGLLGIGGGSIMVPVFRLVFGLSAVGSTATSLFTIIPTSISGAVTHIREKTCAPKLGLVMGAGGACTSALGVMLAQVSPSWAVMLGTAIVIAYSATTMLRKAIGMPKRDEPARSARVAVAESQEAAGEGAAGTAGASAGMTKRQIATGFCIGLLTGLASGYVGLGGGFLMVPLMTSFMGMSMKQTSGTSLIAIIILALPATIAQCAIGNVDYAIGVAVACGSIPGAFFGAKLVSRVPERALRFFFAGFLGVAAVLLVVKEFGLLG